MTNLPYKVVSGVAYFSGPIANPLEVFGVLYEGAPPIAQAGQAFLVHGAGRTGYGFARMAARAPGNEDSLVMVVPRDIREWYRLSVLNGNSECLSDGIVFNPDWERPVHILPPRKVEEKISNLGVMARQDSRLGPVLVWAGKQLQDGRNVGLAEYWTRAAQVQAITTRVADMPSVLNERFIKGLHADVKYTILHPSKSMTAARHKGEKPLFGHELLQALLTEGGRGDLTGWVVASGGYWIDSTIWNSQRVRLRFASFESKKAVDAAMRVVGGPVGSYPLVSITGEVGAAAVFGVQFGGWIKNFLANLLGEEIARQAFACKAENPDYGDLQITSVKHRNEMIVKAEELAARAMKSVGLLAEDATFHFFREILEDITACTTINWPALISEVGNIRQIIAGHDPEKDGHLRDAVRDTIRAVLSALVNSSSEVQFGSTNMSAAIAYGLALTLAEKGFISSYRDVFDRDAITVPEGVRSMNHVGERFAADGLPEEFLRGINRFEPLRIP